MRALLLIGLLCFAASCVDGQAKRERLAREWARQKVPDAKVALVVCDNYVATCQVSVVPAGETVPVVINLVCMQECHLR